MTAAKRPAATKPAPDDGRRRPGQAYGSYMLERMEALDRLLVSRGWPAISPWWWKQLRRFYLSGRRRFVLRVGRRGGKSSTMCRVAVVEALFGEHVVPPGDVGTYLIVSQNANEANKRLQTIREILDAMRITHSPLGEGAVGILCTSLFSGRRVAFQVFAATIAGVSGPTGIGALFDEVAKWRDRDTGANPATQVLASARPTMATQKATAHEFMISSPFSTLDAHYEAMKQGDSAAQLTAEAPTWTANPTITEADTKELEPDEATRLREYGAIPMSDGAVFFFDHAIIDAALLRVLPPGPRRVAAGADPAWRSDAAACVPSARVLDFTGPLDVLEIIPKPGAPLVPGPTIEMMATFAKALGCTEFVSDMHAIDTMMEEGKKNGIRVHEGYEDKERTYLDARARANAGLWCLAGQAKLAKQLKETMSQPTPAGRLKIFSPRRQGSHGDIASAWVEVEWFLAQGGGRILLPSSMARAGRGEPGGDGGRWAGCGERGF